MARLCDGVSGFSWLMALSLRTRQGAHGTVRLARCRCRVVARARVADGVILAGVPVCQQKKRDVDMVTVWVKVVGR